MKKKIEVYSRAKDIVGEIPCFLTRREYLERTIVTVMNDRQNR